jgi:hypothetical protein
MRSLRVNFDEWSKVSGAFSPELSSRVKVILARREPGWPRGNRPPHHVMWELWKPGKIMSCEINDHPLGVEIRCYLRGEFYYSRVHPVRFAAQEEAEEKRRELLDAAWSEHPPRGTEASRPTHVKTSEDSRKAGTRD